MSALEPGLYRATVCGIPDTIVTVKPGAYATTYAVGRYNENQHRDITDARPLIVLDFDSDVFAKVVGDLRYAVTALEAHSPRRAFITEIAGQIEAQTKPARIPEPEPGERVTASPRPTPDQPETFLRLRWSKTKDEEGWNWVSLATGHVYPWHNLIDPSLIREGVTS